MGHWWVLGVNQYSLWCTVCCLSWCQLTLRKIQLFQRRDMSWKGFLLCRSRAFEIPFPKWNSGLKLWSKCMTDRVSSKNKEKKAKRKNSVNKRDQTGKKRYKETENSVTGSRTRFICTCKQLLDHCTTVTRMIWQINFAISKHFFPAIDAVWSCWSCIYHEFKYTFEENKLKRVFHSYFALFRVQRADSM